MSVISNGAWNELVAANKSAVGAGWAERGVFATGVGSQYVAGGKTSVLYVGKSAGPLGSLVGSEYDQIRSSLASSRWMEQRINKSAYWQMIDLVDRTRRSLAWTNIAKMDRRGGGVPPKAAEWAMIQEACLRALKEELIFLRPRVTVFATSDYVRRDVESLLQEMGYAKSRRFIDDGWTTLFANGPQTAIVTKHPQGWPTPQRNAVVQIVRDLLAEAA